MRLVCMLLMLLTLVPSAGAATYEVPGDFYTIQGAVNHAIDGDEIVLTSSLYTGPGNTGIIFGGKAITIRSQSGDPANCEMCAEQVDRLFEFMDGEGPSSMVAGITMTAGLMEDGGAVLCEDGCSPTFRDCVFSGNGALRNGGAVWCGMDANPTFEGCAFRGNTADEDGGAVEADAGAPSFTGCIFSGNTTAYYHGGAFSSEGFAAPSFVDCEFISNVAGELYPYGEGGAIRVYGHCDATITDCLFVDNYALAEGGAISSSISGIHVTGSVFVGNHARWTGGSIFATGINGTATLEYCTFTGSYAETGGSVSLAYHCDCALRNCTLVDTLEPDAPLCCSEVPVQIDNTIIADGQGVAIACDVASVVQLACCDLHGNAGGDWVGLIASQLGVNGNIWADPVFCDPENGDYTLGACSPCTPFSPPNPECDLIGAWPEGCGLTPTNVRSWGGVKALFR